MYNFKTLYINNCNEIRNMIYVHVFLNINIKFAQHSDYFAEFVIFLKLNWKSYNKS